jgi:hypothetical protein
MCDLEQTDTDHAHDCTRRLAGAGPTDDDRVLLGRDKISLLLAELVDEAGDRLEDLEQLRAVELVQEAGRRERLRHAPDVRVHVLALPLLVHELQRRLDHAVQPEVPVRHHVVRLQPVLDHVPPVATFLQVVGVLAWVP